MIDSHGRLWGRFNLVDTLVLLFVLGLIPVAYATYLLFRPAAPVISTVERVEITREERRVSGGNVLLAKLKVRGSGFSPMLRARLGDAQAIGFVFENPNSADVIVGELPPGTYDLVLVDGVHEVARAAAAFTVEATPVRYIRAAGYLVDLARDRLDALTVGGTIPAQNPQVKVIALGPPSPARTRLTVGDHVTDVPTPDRLEREAVLTLRCDPRAAPEPCTYGGQPIAGSRPEVSIPTPAGWIDFVVTDVFPDSPPQRLDVVVRLAGGEELRALAVADRDALLDERAATITRVGSYRASGATGTLEITVSLGADDSREGWRYRGQLVRPGAPLALTLPEAMVVGTVQQLLQPPSPGHDDGR
jgi:hypothetical protein